MTAPVFDEPFPLPLVPTGEKAGGLSPFTNAPTYFRHSACHNVDNFVRFVVVDLVHCRFINALCHVNVEQLAKGEQNLLLPCRKQSDTL